jgi:alanine dehydrogenase
MHIGVPRETREEEYRVALTPAGTRELIDRGHRVLVERGAGHGSLFEDEAYVVAGAQIVDDAQAVYAQADLIVKVKEPGADERCLLEPRHVLITFLNLASDPELAQGLIASKATCVAYENVEGADGCRPLLAPMSQIAGRLAPQVAANLLERTSGGKGKLFGGATGAMASTVVILGAGIAGSNAAVIASGLGARTIIFDVDLEALAKIRRVMPHVQTLHSDQMTIDQEVVKADVVIAAVLVPGLRCPILVSEDVVRSMQRGSVIVDMTMTNGGTVATSEVTTHRLPTFEKHGLVHYCVDNMASAVPISATVALTNATLPYIIALADNGVVAAARSNSALARGVDVMEGKITNRVAAEATGNPYFPLDGVLPIEYM